MEKGAPWSAGKIAVPAFNHYAFSPRVGRAISLRFRPSRYVKRNSKGQGRGSQRKLTVLSLPGLLCDRSSSNGGSAPDGREAGRTPAKPSPRRRPSCSAAPRETHPAALQQTTTRHDDALRCITKDTTLLVVCLARGQYLPRARARARLDNRERESALHFLSSLFFLDESRIFTFIFCSSFIKVISSNHFYIDLLAAGANRT